MPPGCLPGGFFQACPTRRAAYVSRPAQEHLGVKPDEPKVLELRTSGHHSRDCCFKLDDAGEDVEWMFATSSKYILRDFSNLSGGFKSKTLQVHPEKLLTTAKNLLHLCQCVYSLPGAERRKGSRQ